MTSFDHTTLRKLERLLREILNSTINNINWEKLHERGITFRQKMQESFRFNSEREWKFLMSSLDVLGDTQMAIVHFQNGQFDSNKIEVDEAEVYLNVYGVLSAIYIQKMHY